MYECVERSVVSKGSPKGSRNFAQKEGGLLTDCCETKQVAVLYMHANGESRNDIV